MNLTERENNHILHINVYTYMHMYTWIYKNRNELALYTKTQTEYFKADTAIACSSVRERDLSLFS